jgi:hypothetical protein
MTRTTRAQGTMRHTTMTHPYLRPETHMQVFAPTTFLAVSLVPGPTDKPTEGTDDEV